MSERKGNPLSPKGWEQPCGAVDPTVKFPTLQHYDCHECKKRVIAILLARKPGPIPQPKGVTGVLFDDVKPKKLRAR